MQTLKELKFNVITDAELFQMGKHLGVNKPIMAGLINRLRKWQNTLGYEATLSRLKAIFIWRLTGIKPSPSIWIAEHIKHGKPKGEFGTLFEEWFGYSKSLKIMKIMISGAVAKQLTPSQWRKFYHSAERHHVFTTLEDFPELQGALRKVVVRHKELFARAANAAKFDDPYKWVDANVDSPKLGRNFKPEVVEKFRKERKTLAQLVLEIPDIIPTSIARECKHVGNNPYYLGCGLTSRTMSGNHAVDPNVHVGNISIIQERGIKARVIASPKKCHQMALSRLGNFLSYSVRNIPGDCTYDQQEGINHLQDTLIANKTVYCHDLSDATNNLPRRFCIEVLRMIKDNLHPDHWQWFEIQLQLFEWLSAGDWTLPPESMNFIIDMKDYEGDYSTMKFNVGIPQGLVASFPTLALVHNLLIMAAESMCYENSGYRILGDDIFMSSKSCSDTYVRYCRILDMPINAEKSITSDKIGEFAGKIVTKHGQLDIEKWKFPNSIPGYLSFYTWLGSTANWCIPHQYRKVCKFIAGLPSPLGLGLNPDGLSLDIRLPYEAVVKYEMLSLGLSPLPSNDSKVVVERRLGIVETFLQVKQTEPNVEVRARRPDEYDPVMRNTLNLHMKVLSTNLPDKMAERVERMAPLVRKGLSTGVSSGGPVSFLQKLWRKLSGNL